MRIPMRLLPYRGKMIPVPAVKIKRFKGKKILVPLKPEEQGSLNVMPYWNKQIDSGGRTITLKKSTFRIPMRGIKQPIRLIKRYPPRSIGPVSVRIKVPSKSTIKQGRLPLLTRNQQNFVKWIKKFNPKLYQAALLRTNEKHGLAGIADFFGDLTSSLTNLAPAYLQFKQQKDLMKMQLQRAQQGLPPAKVADYAPVIKTQVDLAPATRTAMVGGMKDMMMPLMIGGGALLFILAMKKRRR